MVVKEITIANPLGLHARPAAKVVKTAKKFRSQILLEKNGEKVDGKSILEVLTLAAEKGDVVKVIAMGEDEREALREVVSLLSQEKI